MTDDTIRIITASVKMALEPSLDRIHDRIDEVHGRVTQVSREVSAMGGLVSQMPTLEDQQREIANHMDGCEKRRRWKMSMIIGIPAALLAMIGIVSAIRTFTEIL